MSATATPTNLRSVYDCPDWCVLPEDHHSFDIYDGRAIADHSGPQFGLLFCSATTIAGTGEIFEIDATFMGDLDLERGFKRWTAAELRQLASDALAAAEWLEKHGGGARP